ncbi:hypothetical protein QBC35DRAFT_219114 [Podospora australis]|uniref:Uncharacterized protein n=1 Tax=Podospora australis TaxID=1536484 RepID=A0AAN7AIH8_9PEZI|nr:hypothetical protein QBC35DRAFT_219114 [Podospora australis]
MTSKSIIVTGACSGIGLAVVRHFASQPEGHQIALLDVNAGEGPGVAAKLAEEFPQVAGKTSFHKCDVSSWEEQTAVFKEVFALHGNRLDVVFANAGISEQGVTTLVDREEGGEPTKPRLKVLEINLFGVVYSVKLAAFYMNKKPKGNDKSTASRGSIICTASNAGLYPLPTAPLYAASKAGVVGLVRSTKQLIEDRKIQINALAPAVLETNIAPSKDLFKPMIVTPMTTLIKGVDKFLQDPSLSGQIAEIHGESVTLRDAHEFVDEDSKKNIEMFWTLGYA